MEHETRIAAATVVGEPGEDQRARLAASVSVHQVTLALKGGIPIKTTLA